MDDPRSDRHDDDLRGVVEPDCTGKQAITAMAACVHLSRKGPQSTSLPIRSVDPDANANEHPGAGDPQTCKLGDSFWKEPISPVPTADVEERPGWTKDKNCR